MSKLALLAQKRREEAQARASPAPPGPQHDLLQPSAAATPLADTAADRPLSKLAQKMAAARAAKVEAAAKEVSPLPTPTSEEYINAMEIDATPGAGPSSLFSSTPRASCRPSTFFNLLTKPKQVFTASGPSSEPTTTTSLHLPYVHDPTELERRVQAAFGPGVDSPDDIVLKARGGRAGTTAGTAENGDGPAVKPKPVKAPAKSKAAQVSSEASKSNPSDGVGVKVADKGGVKKSGARKPLQGSQSTATLEKPVGKSSGSSGTVSKGSSASKANIRPQGIKSAAGPSVSSEGASAPPRPKAGPDTSGAQKTTPTPGPPRQQSTTTADRPRPKALAQGQPLSQGKSRVPRPASDGQTVKTSPVTSASNGGEGPRGPPIAKPRPKSKVVQGPP